MPIKIIVKDGPSFKALLAHGPLGESPCPMLAFTIMDETETKFLCLGPQHDWEKPWLTKGEVISIGRVQNQPSDSDKDLQTLIIETEDEYWRHYFIVTTYNTKTRVGSGMVFTEDEFFKENPVTQKLYQTKNTNPFTPPVDWPGIFRPAKSKP